MERIVFSRKYVKSEQLDEIEVTIDEVHKLMYYVDYFNKNNFEEKIHLEKKIPELGALNKIYIRLIEIYEPIHLHFQSCYIDPYDYVSEGSKSYRSIEEFSKIKTQEMLTKGVDGARVILEKIYPVYIEYLSTVSSILAETRLFVDKIISTDSDFAEVIINSTDLTEDFYTIYPSKELVLNNKNE